MHEGCYARSTNRARVVLHPNDLAAALAETEMSAWQHYRVLHDGEADDTLTLGLIS